MDEIAAFLQHHRSSLLRYLDGEAPRKPGDPDALDFVYSVLDDWAAKFNGRRLPEPCLRERTFWFALYQLEELGDIGGRDIVDPYELLMLDNLKIVREALRNNADLPAGCFATRPGESIGEDDELNCM